MIKFGHMASVLRAYHECGAVLHSAAWYSESTVKVLPRKHISSAASSGKGVTKFCRSLHRWSVSGLEMNLLKNPYNNNPTLGLWPRCVYSLAIIRSVSGAWEAPYTNIHRKANVNASGYRF